MEKEIVMRNTQRHRMLAHSFVIDKPSQVHHFQIRLPRNTKSIIAIDYDVFFSGTIDAVSDATGGSTHETNPNVNPNGTEQTVFNRQLPLDFSLTKNHVRTIGRLKLQSLEKANLFYNEWLKAQAFDDGISPSGIFPAPLNNLLNKQKPKSVEVSPLATILNGLFQDYFLSVNELKPSYLLKVFVWVETTENNNGVEFEFLTPKKP